MIPYAFICIRQACVCPHMPAYASFAYTNVEIQHTCSQQKSDTSENTQNRRFITAIRSFKSVRIQPDITKWLKITTYTKAYGLLEQNSFERTCNICCYSLIYAPHNQPRRRRDSASQIGQQPLRFPSPSFRYAYKGQ